MILGELWSYDMYVWDVIIHKNQVLIYITFASSSILVLSRTLQWRHNERDEQPFIQAQIKKNHSSASLAFVRGIHR